MFEAHISDICYFSVGVKWRSELVVIFLRQQTQDMICLLKVLLYWRFVIYSGNDIANGKANSKIRRPSPEIKKRRSQYIKLTLSILKPNKNRLSYTRWMVIQYRTLDSYS